MGLFLSAEIAYHTYIYAKVDKEHYQQVTSHLWSAALLARFLGAVLGQVLYMFQLVSLDTLLYITLTCKWDFYRWPKAYQ